MKAHLHRHLIRLTALATIAVPAAAHAFSAQGYVWVPASGQAVPYVLQPEGSDDVSDDSDLTALRNAFNTWEEVACSALTFSEAAWQAPRQVANDGTNRVMFVEDEAEWPGQPGTLALTYTFYQTSGPREIIGADMIFNGVNWTWTTVDAEVGQGSPAKVDLETVAFHEVGHFLGLDHSQDEDAAMFPDNNKLMQRGPANDDIQGVCSLYPNGQMVPGGGGATGAPVGSPCQEGPDCASTLCLDDQQIGRTYCTDQCNPAQQDCPNGYVCEDTQQFGGLCFAPSTVDEMCDQCGSAAQCASGLCVTVPNVNFNRPFCSRACDPTPGQPQQCPNGYQCVGTQQGTTFVGACVPNTGVCDPAGKGGQNEACYANGSCKPGLRCTEYYPGSGLGLDYCYGLCNTPGQGCGLARTVCTPLDGVMNTAVCLTFAQVGEPCIPEVCEGNAFCAWDETAGIDSAICYLQCPGGQNDCPANHQCQGFEGIPPLCVPNEGFKPDGDACTADAECVSSVCRTVADKRLCTRSCSTQNPDDCTPGLRCLAGAGSETGLCWPEALTDPRTSDPSRGDGVVQEACVCDTTFQCDDDCPCDPECEGGACACVTVEDDAGAEGAAAVLGVLVLAVLRRRRRA